MGRAYEWLSAGSAVFPAMFRGRFQGARARRQSEKNTSLRRPFVFLDAEMNRTHTAQVFSTSPGIFAPYVCKQPLPGLEPHSLHCPELHAQRVCGFFVG